MNAGPAANADARKRGAIIAEFQNGPAAQPDVQKRRHGVNADRPEDRHEHERDVEDLARLHPAIGAVDQIPADVQVQQQVTVERDHVPTEHRKREVEPQKNVHEAIRPTEIDRHEQQTHDDRGHREQLAKNHQIVQIAIAVDIHGNHEHHRGGGHADQEREVRDVQPPRDLVGHPGQRESVDELPAIRVQPEQHKNRQHEHPGVIAPIADEADPKAAPQKLEVGLHARPPFCGPGAGEISSFRG